jgi:hypothetical protein
MVENFLAALLEDLLKPSDSQLDGLQVVNEVIELIKQQVQVQRWKEAEAL